MNTTQNVQCRTDTLANLREGTTIRSSSGRSINRAQFKRFRDRSRNRMVKSTFSR